MEKEKTGVATKKILIDEDLILHGYTFKFSELVEYLLQMAREQQKYEEKEFQNSICFGFCIETVNIQYGTNINISSDFSKFIHECGFLNETGIEFIHNYLLNHDEWDDIPTEFLKDHTTIYFEKDENMTDCMIIITIDFHTVMVEKDPETLEKYEIAKEKTYQKLKIKAKAYFSHMMNHEIGPHMLLHLDRGVLYEFMKAQQLFENDETALILGKEFLSAIIKSEEFLKKYEKVPNYLNLYRRKRDENSSQK